ncbi:MAG TPA: PHP domain-containing protein [Sumerlaeia bacterium]|nr:PHP domain-containing protein [Sumerlaeia bacterium]
MERLKYDFHIHTKYLGCANETMEVPAIVRECARLGMGSIAIADHLNSLDRLALHVPIKRDIQALEDPALEVFFAVELNFTGPDEGFAFSEEVRDEYGFQFAIGGIHNSFIEEYDLRKIVEIQHRHHLKTCEDPLVQVLVHPYWFGASDYENRGWPPFDSMRAVPESLVRELGQAARETDTAIEINCCMVARGGRYSDAFVSEYIDFLAMLAEEGARFAPGSDAHDIGGLAGVAVAWDAAERLALSAEQIWRPSCPPFAGGAAPDR